MCNSHGDIVNILINKYHDLEYLTFYKPIDRFSYTIQYVLAESSCHRFI